MLIVLLYGSVVVEVALVAKSLSVVALSEVVVNLKFDFHLVGDPRELKPLFKKDDGFLVHLLVHTGPSNADEHTHLQLVVVAIVVGSRVDLRVEVHCQVVKFQELHQFFAK